MGGEVMLKSGGNQMGSKFWVPILISVVITVAMSVSTVYLATGKASQAKEVERILIDQTVLRDTDNRQNDRILRLEVTYEQIYKLLQENTDLLRKHVGVGR